MAKTLLVFSIPAPAVMIAAPAALRFKKLLRSRFTIASLSKPLMLLKRLNQSLIIINEPFYTYNIRKKRLKIKKVFPPIKYGGPPG